jgi:hypothetical protein
MSVVAFDLYKICYRFTVEYSKRCQLDYIYSSFSGLTFREKRLRNTKSLGDI